MTTTETNNGQARSDWLVALRRYLVVIGVGNLIWEILHLPLYTIWVMGRLRDKIVAVAHCTAGDVAIAMVTLLASLALFGTASWPRERLVAVAATATLAGIAYTTYSEWLNTEVLRNWAYSDLMPRVPGLGVGLSPLLQWTVLPPLAFWTLGRTSRSRPRRSDT
jgi:hypothetical protein